MRAQNVLRLAKAVRIAKISTGRLEGKTHPKLGAVVAALQSLGVQLMVKPSVVETVGSTLSDPTNEWFSTTDPLEFTYSRIVWANRLV
jgi:hypothetical protein